MLATTDVRDHAVGAELQQAELALAEPRRGHRQLQRRVSSAVRSRSVSS